MPLILRTTPDPTVARARTWFLGNCYRLSHQADLRSTLRGPTTKPKEKAGREAQAP